MVPGQLVGWEEGRRKLPSSSESEGEEGLLAVFGEGEEGMEDGKMTQEVPSVPDPDPDPDPAAAGDVEGFSQVAGECGDVVLDEVLVEASGLVPSGLEVFWAGVLGGGGAGSGGGVGGGGGVKRGREEVSSSSSEPRTRSKSSKRGKSGSRGNYL